MIALAVAGLAHGAANGASVMMSAITMSSLTLSRPGRWSARAILVVLVALSAIAAHQIPYATGPAVSGTAVDAGHDRFWMPLVVLVLAATVGLALATTIQLRRLAGRSTWLTASAGDETLAAYLAIAFRLWLHLAVLTMVFYAAQENIERILAGETLLGLDVLAIHGWLPVSAVAIASLLVAVVAGLFVWRRKALLARLAMARSRRVRRPATARRPRRSSALPSQVVITGGGIRAPPGVPLSA